MMHASYSAVRSQTALLASLQQASRVSNEAAKNVPLLYPQGVFLPFYICYLVGYRQGKKCVEMISLLKQKKGKHVHYYIVWYPYGIGAETFSFWVYTGAALKNKLFAFTDRLSFMRATFVDLPGVGLVRLSFLPHMRLPESSATSCTCVYALHQKATLVFPKSMVLPSTTLGEMTDSETGDVFFSAEEWQQQPVATQQSLRLLYRHLQQPHNTRDQKQALKRLLLQLLNSL